MPSSPFAGIGENCTLKFHVATGEATTDDAGNVIDEYKLVTVRAVLQKAIDALARQINRDPGVENNAWLLQGFCIEPMILPASIDAETWADCTWSGIEGKFYLIAPINAPHGRQGIGAILEQATGTKINGFFQVKRS